MPDSLRTRLMLWYALLMAIVVAIVGTAVWFAVWRSRIGALDAELRARAESVAGAVREVRGQQFDIELAPADLADFQRVNGAYFAA